MENNVEKTYWLQALSPLHVGAGRGVGYIDLPIIREKVTNWPYIPGSAVKGVVADRFRATPDARKNDAELSAAFGRANDDKDIEAGAASGSLVFSDASIVCLPVRSFYGTFAWLTSPLALKRLRNPRKPGELSLQPESDEVFTLRENAITPKEGPETAKEDVKVYLEDIDLKVRDGETLQEWGDFLAGELFAGDDGWQKIFRERFALVNDDIFTFLCETGTEVSARIRIKDDTKIVSGGALWYEESLPVETVLAGVIWCDRVYGSGSGKPAAQRLMERFCKEPLDLQIGGKASIGKGRVRCVFSGEAGQ
ncbi:MAG: type III-B CRISPR module RAMP protein Cmr4 [Synergistaceae bacterium]|jgi:CRISPR-associated protein Cmr4|nr:type III-B CRISPR module RAMP protein Cmr4 [Synergistaceae bacterium]